MRQSSAPEAASRSALVLATAGRVVLLPVLAVDLRDRHAGDGAFVQAARVDAEAVRVRARHVEGFHAAVPAKAVLRGAGIELVRGQRIFAGEQLEALLLDRKSTRLNSSHSQISYAVF